MADRLNVIVIAPHPDDESIGCGGATCLHAARGDRVGAVFLTSGEAGLKHLPPDEAWRVREREAEAAAAVLGTAWLAFLRMPDWTLGAHTAAAAAALRPLLDREAPGLIYLPHAAEWHPDHQAALPIVRAAVSGSARPAPVLRGYEVWTPLPAHDHVEDVTPAMARKLRAVRCYASQLGHFRYDLAVRGLNQYRGRIAARTRFAEVFQEQPVNGDGTPA